MQAPPHPPIPPHTKQGTARRQTHPLTASPTATTAFIPLGASADNLRKPHPTHPPHRPQQKHSTAQHADSAVGNLKHQLPANVPPTCTSAAAAAPRALCECLLSCRPASPTISRHAAAACRGPDTAGTSTQRHWTAAAAHEYKQAAIC